MLTTQDRISQAVLQRTSFFRNSGAVPPTAFCAPFEHEHDKQEVRYRPRGTLTYRRSSIVPLRKGVLPAHTGDRSSFHSGKKCRRAHPPTNENRTRVVSVCLCIASFAELCAYAHSLLQGLHRILPNPMHTRTRCYKDAVVSVMFAWTGCWDGILDRLLLSVFHVYDMGFEVKRIHFFCLLVLPSFGLHVFSSRKILFEKYLLIDTQLCLSTRRYAVPSLPSTIQLSAIGKKPPSS